MRLSDGPAGSPSRPRPRYGPTSGLAAQPPQRGQDEQRRADDRRQRVARQAEHERRAAPPEPQRLARLDPHAPEDLVDAAGLEGGLDVVVRADRDAAGDDQDVALQPELDHRPACAAGRPGPAGSARAARPPAARASRPRSSSTRRSCPARAAAPGLEQLAAGDDRGRRAASAARRRSRLPAEASADSRGTVSTSPGRASTSPACTSSPRRRMCRPGETEAVATTVSPRASVSSTLSTASAPARDRRAGRDPRRGARLEREPSAPPAARSPITRSSAPGATSAARTA